MLARNILGFHSKIQRKHHPLGLNNLPFITVTTFTIIPGVIKI